MGRLAVTAVSSVPAPEVPLAIRVRVTPTFCETPLPSVTLVVPGAVSVTV